MLLIKRKYQHGAVLIWALCIVICLVIVPRTDAAGAVAQAFATNDTSLVAGTLVTLKSDSANVVEKSTVGSTTQLLGVAANNSLVSLGEGKNQVQVVVSGLTPVLVSNINGNVKVGDKITASPIEGVGMKAMLSSEIIGTAESNLPTVKQQLRLSRMIPAKART